MPDKPQRRPLRAPDHPGAPEGLPPIVRDDEDAALWMALESLAEGRAAKFKDVRRMEDEETDARQRQPR